jgi:hypothetical protein
MASCWAMVLSRTSAPVMARSARTRMVWLDSPASSDARVPLPAASATPAWKLASWATNSSSSPAWRILPMAARRARRPAASMRLAASAVAAGSR